jgi:hypothetical protein
MKRTHGQGAALISAALFAFLVNTANAASPEIIVLSNRADLISGGDALVQIKLPAGSNPAFLKVDVDGRSVRSAFAFLPDGSLGGLVTGLKIGVNTLRAVLPAGRATIPITNHDIGGPVFSGPQVQPWVCQTTNNPSLGPAIDDKCNAPSAYRYRYRTTAGAFANYDPNAPRPANMGTTTTDQGVTVDYIIRIERGTADRGIHEIAVLFDPTKSWGPFAPQPGWNGKVFVPFGSGCEYGHLQGNPGSVEYD